MEERIVDTAPPAARSVRNRRHMLDIARLAFADHGLDLSSARLPDAPTWEPRPLSATPPDRSCWRRCSPGGSIAASGRWIRRSRIPTRGALVSTVHYFGYR